MFHAGSDVRIVGHRGAAGVAPENTVASIERAVSAGAHAIEIDLHATSDGVPTSDGVLVAFHDETLERTTDGSGRVEEHTLEALRELDAGYRFSTDRGRSFPFRGRGIAIPTLDEAVAAAADLPMVLEVKSARAGRALGQWLEIRRSAPGDTDRFIVGGFERDFVAPAAAAADHRCATRADLLPFVLLGKLGLPAPLPESVDALMVPIRKGPVRLVTRGVIRRAHAHGAGVYPWTIDRADVMRHLLGLGVDGLISNVPARVRRILAEH